jgi:hypothetical protein
MSDAEAKVLDAVERAVGLILQDTYSCEPDDGRGRLEADIEGFIRHQMYLRGLPAPTEVVFTKGWDDEDHCYKIHAHVRLPPLTPIDIEIVKVLHRPPDEFDGPSVDGVCEG